MNTPDWIIADTHLFHTRLWTVLNPGSRPVDNTKQIIENWRRMVRPSDTVLHLGDVFLGISRETFTDYWPWLPGKVSLIPGNHDQKWKLERLADKGWGILDADSIQFVLFDGYCVHFSHEPESAGFLHACPAYCRNIHGHIHQRDAPSPKHINICPEKVGYKPLRLEDVLKGRGERMSAWPQTS